MKKNPFLRNHCLLTALALHTVLALPSFANEFRGVWVDAFGSGFLNASEVTKLVSDCRTYNFNAVVVQMRRRGDAFYFPQAPNTEPRTTAISSSFDALQDIIDKCHNGTPRIEVHCWVASNLIWSDTSNPPSQSAHVYNSHPEYLMKNSAGATAISEGFYLDPGNPDAMTWNYTMAKDIVSRYDVDGFHWDYIRYPQQDSGYNATAIARYNAEFGLTGQPSPSSSQFSTWRRRQITDFLRWANADLLEIKPHLVISASVFGNRSDATNFRFQEWGAWNSEGILDVCMPMDYTSDNALFQTRINDAFSNQGVRVCYPGIGAYLNTKSNSVAQLNMIRNKPFQGSMFYSYRTPNSGTVNQTSTFTHVRDNYQPTWTDTPVLPWVANPTNAIIKGNIRRLDNSASIYNATVSLSGTASKTQKSGAHGKFAFYEVKPGNYNVSATSGGFSSGPTAVTVAAGQIYNVDLTIDLPAVTDTVAPLISSVNAGSVTSNSCVVTWITSENSDSTVEYGLTSAYGSVGTNGLSAISHTVSLTGLIPATTYNFRVKSKDAAGNEAASDNFQFTTLPAQAEIIIDNTNALVVGSWSTANTSTDKLGTDYRFKSRGTGSAFLEYRPTIPVSGNYQVFEWHPQGTNRPTNAPVVVTFSGISQTNFMNQTINGGKWNFVGTYNLTAGTNAAVRITDAFTETNKSVMADGIRFLYLPSGGVSDIILDNTNATVTGTWSAASSSGDKFGTDYRFRSKGTGTSFLTYTPTISVAGSYQVFEWHPAGANRASDAPHVITFSGGSQTVSVNQQGNGGKWNLLGTFNFNPGTSGNVKITDAFTLPTNGVVMADAIRFSFVAPPSAPNAPSGVAATTVSSSQINVSWTDNSTNELNFIVSRGSSAEGPFVDIATVAANSTSFSSTGLSPDTTYFFGVRSVNIGGSSAMADGASATTFPLPPTAPSDLIASAVSSSEIDLAWTDNDNDIDTQFKISRSTSVGGPFVDIATVPSQSTSYRDGGLQGNQTYFYQVRAVNTGGTSANSNIASATTLSAAPAAPSNLQANAVSSSQINLTWTDNSTNENNFVVVRSSSASGPFTPVATLAADTTSYSDSGLSAHTLYFYQVQAVNAGGSASSETASAQTENNAPIANAGTDQTVSTGQNCETSVSLDGSASSDPDDDSLTFSWSGDFGTASGANPNVSLGLGTHIINLTVSDNFGGSSSSSVIIVVNDTTAPVLTLNGANPMAIECHGPTCFKDPGASATDACAGDLTSSIAVSGTVDTTQNGIYTLTYTVTDPSGNTATATRNVHVVDTVSPGITLNGISPMIVECHSVFTDPGVTAHDACDSDISLSVTKSGEVDANSPGIYTITYTATDTSGNSSSLERFVSVVDTTAPALTLNSSSEVTLEANSSFIDPGATALDACAGNVSSGITVSGSVNTALLGDYSLTYSVSDIFGNTATANRLVHVVDTTKPVLTLIGSSLMTIECHSSFIDPGAIAFDSYAGDLTGAIQVSGAVNSAALGSYVLTYSVSDPSGNTSIATRIVNVVDTTAPAITLSGDSAMTVEAGSTFSDPGATANDECAGDLTAAILVSGSVNTSVVGTYTITYSVTDPSGNSANIIRTVSVVDTTAPNIISLVSSRTSLWPPNHKMVPVALTASVSDVLDSTPDIRIVKIESNEPVEGLGDGDTGPDWEITGAMTCSLRAERSGLGENRIYTITVESTDDYGNSSFATVTVTVPHDSGVASNQ